MEPDGLKENFVGDLVLCWEGSLGIVLAHRPGDEGARIFWFDDGVITDYVTHSVRVMREELALRVKGDK